MALPNRHVLSCRSKHLSTTFDHGTRHMSSERNVETAHWADILTDVSSRARDYVKSLPDRSVSPSREAIEALAQFDEPLPMEGAGLEATIDKLDRVGSPATVATAGGDISDS